MTFMQEPLQLDIFNGMSRVILHWFSQLSLNLRLMNKIKELMASVQTFIKKKFSNGAKAVLCDSRA